MRGWWSGHKVVDPVELERRYSNEDGMSFMDAIFYDEVSEEGKELLVRVEGTLDLLPPTEADFVELYYFQHMKQTDIATIFGVSQPTVCYRLQRACSRIQFLLSLPALKADEMKAAMSEFLDDPLDTEIMLLMYQTTCQSEVAKRLGVSQGFVRHRFIRSIARMEKDMEAREQIETVANEAIDMFSDWDALHLITSGSDEAVMKRLRKAGHLDPTELDILGAAAILRERQFKRAKESARLGEMLGEDVPSDKELRERTHHVEGRDVLDLAMENRRSRAAEALAAITRREEQRVENQPPLDKFVEIFRAISDNLNILREVQRPAWGDKVMLAIH